MNKKNALLISNGDKIELDNLKEIAKKSDFILCADGGADYCIDASLMPDMVIGDLDSISERALKIIKENKVPLEKFPIKKDATDTELSINYLIHEGFKSITLVGVTGSRMDHTFGNILMLKKLYDSGVKGKIIDKNNIIYLIDKELKLKKRKGYFVSIIPLTPSGISLTLEGFEYNLDKFKLSFSSTHGISNKIVKDKGYIKVHKGMCLVFVSKD